MDQGMVETMAPPLGPPDLASAASMIRHYGQEHGLTPQQLLDVFDDGLVAAMHKTPPPAWLKMQVVRDAG